MSKKFYFTACTFRHAWFPSYILLKHSAGDCSEAGAKGKVSYKLHLQKIVCLSASSIHDSCTWVACAKIRYIRCILSRQHLMRDAKSECYCSHVVILRNYFFYFWVCVCVCAKYVSAIECWCSKVVILRKCLIL